MTATNEPTIEKRRVIRSRLATGAGFAWPVPLVTSPIFAAVAHDRADHFARRVDLSDPSLIREDARRVFYAGMGEFKAYRLPLRVRLIDRVVWFAVGDRKEVRRLVRDVTCLGKKTSQGYGRVAEWAVDFADLDEDACWLAPSEAGPVLMRPLPSGAVPAGVAGARPWFGGVVPPYWASEYFAEGALPC